MSPALRRFGPGHSRRFFRRRITNLDPYRDWLRACRRMYDPRFAEPLHATSGYPPTFTAQAEGRHAEAAPKPVRRLLLERSGVKFPADQDMSGRQAEASGSRRRPFQGTYGWGLFMKSARLGENELPLVTAKSVLSDSRESELQGGEAGCYDGARHWGINPHSSKQHVHSGSKRSILRSIISDRRSKPSIQKSLVLPELLEWQ
jgi:hypothetical protein